VRCRKQEKAIKAINPITRIWAINFRTLLIPKFSPHIYVCVAYFVLSIKIQIAIMIKTCVCMFQGICEVAGGEGATATP
jgi:hypothetical protein